MQKSILTGMAVTALMILIALVLFKSYTMLKNMERFKQQQEQQLHQTRFQLPMPAYPTAEMTDLVTKDLPEYGDRFEKIGVVNNNVMIFLDVTSGKFDDQTWTANFLLLNVMPEGFRDRDNNPVHIISQRIIIECKSKRFRFVNATEVDNDGHVLDFTVYPDNNWHMMDQHTLGTIKRPTAMGVLIKLSCPADNQL